MREEVGEGRPAHVGRGGRAAHAVADATAEPHVVVSAGGGRVGGPLLLASLEAHRIVRSTRPLRTTLACGPFLPDAEFGQIAARARSIDGVTVHRSVPALGPLLDGASASISQCGYNTALELLLSGVPALVVPFTAPAEDEQMRRARRLASLGAVRVLRPAEADGPRLAAELGRTLAWRPRAVDVTLDGAARSADLLHELVQNGVRGRA